ncbi:MAG: Mut7-C ubiquitin/RNAse domain-containing protein [Candidatus Aureabacteria bacterium]|nr:Mut7-C ubiquitin/RNAse domain-containing protein [Candidatus Auribacterota bacterium]
MQYRALFRFYAELNDFLPDKKKHLHFQYAFNGTPAIKDAIEALGIPHTEVALILVNGKQADFSYHLQHEDQVSVYPVFTSLDISSVTTIPKQPLPDVKFICDVHLGKLARHLRMLGLDTLYQNDYTDKLIVRLALEENRCILTKDMAILKNKSVIHGCFIRSNQTIEQVRELMNRLDLSSSIHPFSRCLKCNGLIVSTEKASISDHLKPKTKQYYHEFFRCQNCNGVYWKGSHYQKMMNSIEHYRK